MRRRSVAVALLLVALSSAARARGEVSGTRIQRLVELLADRNYKVRLQSALALGQLRDRRAVPALVSALADRHPLVRATASHALGLIGDSRAATPLRERLRDRDALVRRRSRAALDQLRATQRVVLLRLGDVGDRTRRGSSLLPQLRRLWLDRIQRSPGVRLLEGKPQPGAPNRIYEMTSAITQLTLRTEGSVTETTCSVSVVLGDSNGSIVMMTSGGATVQVRSRYTNPSAAQSSALENAVASAHSNVLKFLASR
jgi:hypothetical protein